MSLYLVSALFSFVQGFVMTGISNDVTYSMRKEISQKINKLPMKYFESRTNGEILSRVTNDIDTLQVSLNQSITQLITSITMLIGVFVMMLSINVWMTLIAVLILPISGFIKMCIRDRVAISRCVRMIKEGKVTSITGKELDIKGDTLCVHGDGPKALAFVKRVRDCLLYTS